MVAKTPTRFGELLRRYRLAAGLTQEELAERAGISARGVSDLERGARGLPRKDTLQMLLQALDLVPDDRAMLTAAARRAPDAPAHDPTGGPSFPVPPTPLIGREDEIAAVRALLLDEEVRLLTLTGPGGVGKTRLALALGERLAADFPDGVVFVSLAPLADPALVASAIAQGLGVGEEAGQSVIDRLAARLAGKRLLLIVDNFEHVLEASSAIAELLSAGAGAKFLVTSRAPLRLRGEQEYPVPPLPLPDVGRLPPLDRLAAIEAVALFVQRARSVRPDFALDDENAPAVADICARLDGLPLAIELASARVKLLPPQALLPRLETRLPLLTGGAPDAPPRQRTLRAAIAWSHDLLAPEEQTLFRRLAVFAGDFTLEAAESVAGDRLRVMDPAHDAPGTRAQPAILDLLASLVDQSLLPPPQHGAGEPRFALLETVREYALERLEGSGEAEVIRRAHAEFYLALAEAASARINGPDLPSVLNRLEAEHDNLRAALAWTIERRETALALRLAYASWVFWWMHSHLDQGRMWLQRALALPDADDADSALRPRTLVAAGYFARIQGAYADAVALGEEALALAREMGNTHGIAMAHHMLGHVATDRGEFEPARGHFEAALALSRELGYRHGVAFQFSNLGAVATAQGDFAEAETRGEAALAIWRERGDAWGMASALIQLGKVARARGDEARAMALFRESLVHNADLGDKNIAARAVSELAALAGERGQFRLAARLYGSVAVLREAIGAPLAPAERARHERAVAAARAVLEPAVFAAEWEFGRALPLEQAIAAAWAPIAGPDSTASGATRRMVTQGRAEEPGARRR